MSRKSVTIVTSAFNEEECLPELFARLEKVFALESNYDFSTLIIGNGSWDSTWEIILNQKTRNGSIKAIRMSRNFSLDSAFTCGIDHSESDIVIIMTSDLQDPPESIPALLREYEKGFDQVVVKIKSRDSVPLIRRGLSRVFYKMANVLTEGMLPESVSDFRLMTKKVYKAVSSLRESHRFLRGIGSWVGFNTSTIELDRPPRFAGESKWLGMSIIKVVNTASKSIFAYSTLPLLWVSLLGFIFSFIAILVLGILTLSWFFYGVPFNGFGTITGLITLGFSLTMLCVGVLAQYLGLVYEEVKQRPLYIVAAIE
jgi:dolichol-phosphate mannosyltransferase